MPYSSHTDSVAAISMQNTLDSGQTLAANRALSGVYGVANGTASRRPLHIESARDSGSQLIRPPEKRTCFLSIGWPECMERS